MAWSFNNLRRVSRSFYFFSYIFLTLFFIEVFLTFLAQKSYLYKQLTTNPYRKVQLSSVTSMEELRNINFFMLQPGSIFNGRGVNSGGFVMPELSYDKPNSVFRIVHLGDSQVVGIVPEADGYVRLVNEYLIGDILGLYGKDVESLNMGIPGVGTGTELLVFRLEGIKYQPDLVVLSFFVGNDFLDDYRDLETAQPASFSQDNGFKRLFFNIKSFAFVRNLIMVRQSTETPNSVVNSSGDNYFDFAEFQKNFAYPTFSKLEYTKLIKDKLDLFDKNKNTYQHFAEVSEQILEIKALAESVEAEFVVFIIPDEAQVNSDLLAEVLATTSLSPNSLDVALPQNVLTDFFKKNNINYIDLLPQFLTPDNVNRFYKLQDTHLNFAGNKKAAEVLYSGIVELLHSKQKKNITLVPH